MASLQSQVLELGDRFDSLQRNRTDNQFYLTPPFDYEVGVPAVSNFEKVGETQNTGVTHLAVSFAGLSDPGVERFEVWAQNVQFGNDQPYKVADVTDAPATFQLTSDTDVSVAIRVRTIMKNGLATTLEQSPVITTAITQNPPTIGAGTVGDAALDRSTDPISITSSDILNATIGTADIGNAQITNALIANLAVDTAQIANLAVGNAQINDLAATKITTGTLAADVILASNILATQISAGTLSAVNISAGTFALASGDESMAINATDGFKQIQPSTGNFTRMLGGGFRCSNAAGTLTATMHTDGIGVGDGSIKFSEMINTRVSVNNALGGYRAALLLHANDGRVVVNNAAGAEMARLDSGGGLGQTDSGYVLCKSSGGDLKAEMGVNASGDGEVKINSNYAVVHVTTKKEIVANSVQLASGSKAVASGLTSIDSAVAVIVGGSAPTEYVGTNTPTGGSVTFYSSNASSSAWIHYIIIGTS